ncbi:hypothetical protein QJS04_geneDACA005732 [Acorus gramineus]|uniref:Uncharacterized protein n=1 Tax=Acorus gramineus TaxID=55184 RepID=A0AAV9BJN2_ACOGR|nr:hypothetical protein QJS04_geneDACA005732 [Acorus gramineus]
MPILQLKEPVGVVKEKIRGSFSVRTPLVKVEGFEQLMGGDWTLKHESDEHRLTSPPK